MNTEQRIEIPLNKTKILVMLLGALMFVAIGIWFVVDPPEIDNSYWGNPTRLAIAGYAAIAFFGICAAYFISKLPDKKPGLIIDETGLIDNSSGIAAGHILWTDIENISALEIHKQRLVMLEVRNPQDYIDRQKNFLKRKSMAMNYKMYGTPLSISANGLKIPFPELLGIITRKLQEKKRNAEQQQYAPGDDAI
ncbi:MAG TPA: STM3941 family protein [Flavisolibacter sp.]|nr:STM3941 family protein [Flavisolibacter sp.]